MRPQHPQPQGTVLIRSGSNSRGDATQLCLMELVAHLAGEEHSHKPPCTSPLLAAIACEANDLLSNRDRQALLQAAPELADAACNRCERTRALAAITHTTKVLLPSMLRHHQRPREARMLESLTTLGPTTHSALQQALTASEPMLWTDERRLAIEHAQASLSLLQTPQESTAKAACQAVIAAYHATRATGTDQGPALLDQLRAAINACPHRDPPGETHTTVN